MKTANHYVFTCSWARASILSDPRGQFGGSVLHIVAAAPGTEKANLSGSHSNRPQRSRTSDVLKL